MSQQPERVRASARWLARAMERAGLSARVLETSGNPIVFGARRVAGAEGTVLVYCHFDTNPAPAAGWLQPSPFANANNRQHSPNEHIRLDHL